MHFYEKLETTLDNVVTKNILLLGDFNAKHHEWCSRDFTTHHGNAWPWDNEHVINDVFDLNRSCGVVSFLCEKQKQGTVGKVLVCSKRGCLVLENHTRNYFIAVYRIQQITFSQLITLQL